MHRIRSVFFLLVLVSAPQLSAAMPIGPPTELQWTILSENALQGSHPGDSSFLDLPALTGPGSKLVYAASWFIGDSSPGTMISGAGGRYPSALCGRMVL